MIGTTLYLTEKVKVVMNSVRLSKQIDKATFGWDT